MSEQNSSMPSIDVDENLRLVGTAHVSKESADAVREQIEAWKPDLVAVELCQSRMDALTSGRRLDQEGLSKVIKEGKAPLVLFQSLLAAEQRKMGLEEGQALARAAPSGRLCVVAGAGHTYGAGHPFSIPSRELDEAVEASVTHLLLHLGEG